MPDPDEDVNDDVLVDFDDDVLVPTSVRLPAGLTARLRVLAAARRTTPSALIRGWVELHLADPQRWVPLDAVFSALATLRSEPPE